MARKNPLILGFPRWGFSVVVVPAPSHRAIPDFRGCAVIFLGGNGGLKFPFLLVYSLVGVTLSVFAIKPLVPGHLPAVLALDQECFGGLWSEAGYLRELASDNSELWCIFRQDSTDSPEETGNLVGFGCFWSILEECHLTILAIAPEYRRQGWGKCLLRYLLQRAQVLGLERATLEVKESNAGAIALYTSLGFKKAGLRRGYYQETGENALILWLNHLERHDFSWEFPDSAAMEIKNFPPD